jgi:hypothetical protein
MTAQAVTVTDLSQRSQPPLRTTSAAAASFSLGEKIAFSPEEEAGADLKNL